MSDTNVRESRTVEPGKVLHTVLNDLADYMIQTCAPTVGAVFAASVDDDGEQTMMRVTVTLEEITKEQFAEVNDRSLPDIVTEPADEFNEGD